MIQAALHLHSCWSDGEWTLAQLRHVFGREGCSLIAMTDHAEYFDRQRVARFAAECAALSDDRCLVLPGLEFRCRGKFHILGYGVTELHESDDLETIIAHIARCGGVSVIAHPKNEHFAHIRELHRMPDGIEAWNTKYDGRHTPRPEPFGLLRELRRREDGPLAFYGIDLHWRNQFRGLRTWLDASAQTLSADAVLAALRTGRFEGAAGSLRLPASADIPDALLLRFARINRRSRRLRQALMRAKHMAESLGLRAPAALKAQLRRLF